MMLNTTTLGSITVEGKGSYGIAASAVPRNDDLYTYLRITDITDDGRLITEGLMSVDVVDADVSKYLLKPNDIVFARTGASTGRSYFYDGSVGELVFAGFLIKFSLDPQKVFPRFVKYYCLSDQYRAWVAGHSVGSTRGNCNASDFASLPISLPPLPVQRKIAEILGAYDDLIENNRRRIELLEKMARELYRERFVRRAGNYDDWKIVKLGDIVSFCRGTGYGSKDIISGSNVLLSMNNIRPFGGFIRDYGRRFSGRYNENQKVKAGDLIMSITDMTQDRRIIGYTGLVPPGEDNRIICTHLMKLSSEVCHTYFLDGLFNYSGFSHVISEHATGATVLGLTADVLKDIACRLPPIKEQENYVNCVKPIVELRFDLEEANENLAHQRDRLLPRLLSGKIDLDKLVKEEGENG